MAAPVVQTLLDDDRYLVINVIGEADTVGGKIVDVSALAANTKDDSACTRVRLMCMQYSADATILLDWDADTDLTFAVIPPGQSEFDYSYFGGLTNNAGTGITGDVVIPSPSGSSNYHLTLKFIKKFD